MNKLVFSIYLFFFGIIVSFGANPMATDYSFEDCQGSLMPYPIHRESVSYPDSLTPVMINHIGRHGARFPASSKNSEKLKNAIEKAYKEGTITPLGKQLSTLNDQVIDLSAGRWGALDSLGEYEQRVIASRMYNNFHPIFEHCKVEALSSYSPRAMMSMYSFTHQLDRLSNKIEFYTSTGRQNSMLLRPFDLDADFQDFLKSDELKDVYDLYLRNTCPFTAIDKVLGISYPYVDDVEKRDLAMAEYYVIAGLSAMSVDCDMSKYFTKEEINCLWSCFNLRQYLQRTYTTLSAIPAEIVSELLISLINTTDDYIEGKTNTNVILRFGHAETLMPLLSLMRLKGCYYLTNYFDTVAKHWRDFDIVPMSANLQMIVFYNPKSKAYYLRTDLNEIPVQLLPNDDRVYVPWQDAKKYLMHCVPFYAQ